MPTIVVIGGGFTGAAIAHHFARLVPELAASLVVIEPRSWLGGGLAYSSDDPAHRINVPAAKMSLDPEDGDGFARWLAADDALADDRAALMPDGRAFPQRSVFGRYVRSHIEPLLGEGRIEHRCARAERVHRDGAGFVIDLDDGSRLAADFVVLATSHPPPSSPRLLREGLVGHPRFVPDTTLSGALSAIRPTDRVLVVGTGLTGADVIASLDRTGRNGPIVAVSRRGLRSRGHPDSLVPPYGDFSSAPALTARQLLVNVRAMLGKAEADGLTWHPVFDALRTQGPAIWAALPPIERRRLVRHLRPYWDVHRFRIAPQVEAVLDRRANEGSLERVGASIVAVTRRGDEIDITLRRRGTGERLHRTVDAVVVTTGPAHGAILETESVPRSLAEQGLVRLDPTGLGIEVDRHGRAIDAGGEPVETMIIAGPLARGTFGELMGLPEAALYARFVAEELAAWVAQTRAT